MAVTAKVYANAPKLFADKKIDFDTDTIKVQLHTSTYTPNQSTHDFQDDLTNEVAAAGGYSTGGVTLAGKVNSTTALVTKLDADDAVWAASTITARYAVLVDTTPGTAATNPLIAYVDFGADVISTGGEFRIAWHADGICTFTVA
jgi:hypothetical protein